ncbi:hypothetical protein KC317_g23352, partial [Hortaea werneckii]
ADHPELQAQLHELDQELEDGDITKKGYEKRRTQILSTFLSPRELDALQGTGLRVHNADDTSHPSRPEGHSRAESFASISAGPYAQEQRYEGGGDGSWGEPLAARDEYTLGGGSPAAWQIQPPTPGSYDPGPPSQVQRFQEREKGVRPQGQRQSSYGFSLGPVPSRPESRGSQYSSRQGTMLNSDYAFNPGAPQDQQGWVASPGGNSRLSTMMDSQGYFSDFTSQQHA